MAEDAGYNEIYARAVDLIGVDSVQKLGEHGLFVADGAAIVVYKRERERSNARIRETAAATMRAAGLMTSRVEIEINGGLPRIVVTHPIGDERAFAREIARLAAGLWQPDPDAQIMPPDEADRAMGESRDTTDVDIHAVGPGVPSDDDMAERVQAAAKRVPRA